MYENSKLVRTSYIVRFSHVIAGFFVKKINRKSLLILQNEVII